MVYFSIRVLEFWVMEITNIYGFLHLLNLIKIRPNMDFGGDLAFAHICHNIYIVFFFYFKECGERLTNKDQNKR
jgi:hypothetical protein